MQRGDMPIVTHTPHSSLSGDAATGPRRWVIDIGSCVDVVGEGFVTKKEKTCVEEASLPMRLNTANGEATGSKKLESPLRSSMTTDALTMKG